jgi:uncharacterized membrane protein YdjX (TVP38/TMEM64 family)
MPPMSSQLPPQPSSETPVPGAAWAWWTAVGSVLLVGAALVWWSAAQAGLVWPTSWSEAFGLFNAVAHRLCTWLLQWQAQSPAGTVLAFVLLFAAVSALAVPGASVLALAAGVLFGPWWGTLLITVASAAGATLPFLAARRWLRDALLRRRGWREWLARVDTGVARDGAWYLFSLRVAPVIPFPIANPLFGLTCLPAWTFFWVSAVGMSLGSAAYAFAGAGIADWTLAADAGLPWGLLLGLALLALLPWPLRRWLKTLRPRPSAT